MVTLAIDSRMPDLLTLPFGRLAPPAPDPALVNTRRLPVWVSPVRQRFEELASLPDDWDHRGGSRLSISDVKDALSFLARVMSCDTAAPQIAPLSTGGIQLSWRAGDLEVEVVFDRQRDERVLLVSDGDEDHEADADQADALFAALSDRLGTGELFPA